MVMDEPLTLAALGFTVEGATKDVAALNVKIIEMIAESGMPPPLVAYAIAHLLGSLMGILSYLEEGGVAPGSRPIGAILRDVVDELEQIAKEAARDKGFGLEESWVDLL